MPKRYFQMIPAVDYDVDGDGTTKVAIDILRRVKLRAESLLDGAIFYNYQMQDGDNAEIIADKYYGSSQYHWVVLMMNNILDHTYDLTLNDNNFEGYINATYGSYPRASGLSVDLSSPMYTSSGIRSETNPTEITFEFQTYEKDNKGVDDLDRPLPSTAAGNTGITSGSFPAGTTTAIWVFDDTVTDPFKDIGIGDTVNLFVPEVWYDRATTLIHSGTLTGPQLNSGQSRFYLAENASDVHHYYVGGSITITGEGSGTTGITGNTRPIAAYDPDDSGGKKVTLFTTPGGIFEDEATDEWTYTIVLNPANNFPLTSYTAPAKVVAKSIYKDGEVIAGPSNPSGVWIPDENPEQRYFQINVEIDSTTFKEFWWNKTNPPELVSIQTGIHHFERDLYDASGSTLLAEKVWITQEQYVNTSLGTASTKRIVSNLEYEAEINEEKRIIQLLRREYLDEFVEEFKTLMKLGV